MIICEWCAKDAGSNGSNIPHRWDIWEGSSLKAEIIIMWTLCSECLKVVGEVLERVRYERTKRDGTEEESETEQGNKQRSDHKGDRVS